MRSCVSRNVALVGEVFETEAQGMPKPAPDVKMVQLFLDHGPKIQRQAWKAMDSELFTESFLGMMKSLAKISYNPKKSVMIASMRATKLPLTLAEVDQFAGKVRSAITWVRKRWRDRGSGKFLPAAVVAVFRIWSRSKMNEREVAKKERKMTENIGKAKAAEEKEAGGDTSKKGLVEEKKDIREVFGLGKKLDTECVDLTSDSAKSLPIAMSSGSAASSSSAVAMPSQPATGSPNKGFRVCGWGPLRIASSCV